MSPITASTGAEYARILSVGSHRPERVVLNDKLQELRRETLLTELHQRIRDVRQGSDGLLYVLTDEIDGVLLRLEPASR
jgi:glucose/arabinose dehydrogenase